MRGLAGSLITLCGYDWAITKERPRYTRRFGLPNHELVGLALSEMEMGRNDQKGWGAVA